MTLEHFPIRVNRGGALNGSRERFVSAVEGDQPQRSAAERFGVAPVPAIGGGPWHPEPLQRLARR